MFVGMGCISPRYSSGASGFRSYVSMWLGPPCNQIRMTDVSDAVDAFASARNCSKSESPRPPIASEPISRNERVERIENKYGPVTKSYDDQWVFNIKIGFKNTTFPSEIEMTCRKNKQD